jgi:hypothetical protein
MDPESGVSFFGVEAKLIKIDQSNPAIDFDVVVQPNDWERTIKLARPPSETGKKYLPFFEELVKEYSRLNPSWNKVKPQPQSFLSFGSGRSGMGFCWAFRSGNRFDVELYIDVGDKEENIRIFEELKKENVVIEARFEERISWERLEDRRACRIAVYHQTRGSINVLKEEDFPELVKWGSETMKNLVDVFSPLVKML